MKFYYFPVAPNPTRVLVYLGEKGIELERVQVSLAEGEQNQPAHLARNPRGALPVLELDDGSYLTESLPIMEYLEELHPEPGMIGTTPAERARSRELERLAEMKILLPTARLVHSTNSPIGIAPNPALADWVREQLPGGYTLFNELLGGQAFVGGEAPAIGDCTLFAGLYFGEFFSVTPDRNYAALWDWYERFKERPSGRVI